MRKRLSGLLIGSLLTLTPATALATVVETPLPPEADEAVLGDEAVDLEEAVSCEVPESLYADVEATHWAYTAIVELTEGGLLSGVLPTLAQGGGEPVCPVLPQMRPDAPVSRAELAKLLVTGRGLTPPPAQGIFKDVPKGAWYAPYVELAYRMGMMHDAGKGSFAPNVPASRQEFFAALVRTLGAEGEVRNLGWRSRVEAVSAFNDGREVSDVVLGHVALAVQKGLANGDLKNRLRPKQPATRAEVAAAIYRYLLPVAEKERQIEEVDGQPIAYTQKLTVKATAYGAGEPWLGETTAVGYRVRNGLVAVDPTVIPLGTHLYVKGYGYAVAADTGGAIKGEWIDLYSDNADYVYRFGIQQVTIYLLD